MDKVCAVIDAQGFNHNGIFVPREIAIVANNFHMCFLVDAKLVYNEMSDKDKKTNEYIERQFIGLPLNSSSNCVIKNTIEYILEVKHQYRQLKSTEDDVIGVKNSQFQRILTEFGIPCTNIESFGCPTVEQLNKTYKYTCCSNHYKLRNNYSCALKKCRLLWKWICINKKEIAALRHTNCE